MCEGMCEGKCEEYRLLADCPSLQSFMMVLLLLLLTCINQSLERCSRIHLLVGPVSFTSLVGDGLCSCSSLGKARSRLASFPFGTGVEA